MNRIDRFLQDWRIRKAKPYIPKGSHVLDVGCADGVLFKKMADEISWGVGIDPLLKETIVCPRYRLLPGRFPDDLPNSPSFDVVVMLSVLEHIPSEIHPQVARKCAYMIKSGGRLLITVPTPLVDPIVSFLRTIRILDGMSFEQHYGFDAGRTVILFSQAGLTLVNAEKFQLGLNRLFVFVKQ